MGRAYQWDRGGGAGPSKRCGHMLRISGIAGLWRARSTPETLFFPDMVLTLLSSSLAPLPGDREISIFCT